VPLIFIAQLKAEEVDYFKGVEKRGKNLSTTGQNVIK
jgi:hypothetical protein